MKFTWIKSTILILISMQITIINTCLYSQFFTIYDGSTTATQRTATGGTFLVLWNSTQVGITAASSIFMGFKLLNNYKALSFEATINSYNSNSATFMYNPRTNSQIVYAQFSIVLLKSCTSEIHMYYQQYTTTIISNNNRALNSQTYNLPVGFTFTKTSYLAIPYLSSFHLNSYKEKLDLGITTQAITLSATNIPIVFTSGSTYKDGLSMVAFTLLLIQTTSLIASQAIYYNSLLVTPSTKILATVDFTEMTCAIRMSYLQTDKFQDNPMNIKLTSIGLANTPNIYSYNKKVILVNKYSVFCLSSCPADHYPNGTSCLNCTSLLVACTSCVNIYNCLQCSSGYFIDAAVNNTCTKCLAPCVTCTANTACLTCLQGYYFDQSNSSCIICLPDCLSCNSSTACITCVSGTAVEGGCTTDSACISVNSSISSSSPRCISCYPSSTYTVSGGLCICANGYISASGTCVILTGCLTAVMINSQPLCTNCNNSLNFISLPVNGSCLCNNGYYINSGLCINCLPECLTCQNGSTCLTCSRGYLVQGGCSNSQYCIQVDSTLNFNSNRCLSCRSELHLIASGGICICQAGYKNLNGFCSKDPGCIAAKIINMTIYCTTCSNSGGFQFTPINGVCACRQGYKLQSEICTQICGDGMNKASACDDGNTINGDGCSSLCLLQSKFVCSGTPSTCKYMKYDINITIVKIEKVFMKNEGIFTFKIVPHISSYTSKFLLENLMFTSNRTFTILNKYFVNDIFKVQVQYTQDLQGFDAKINISLNSTLFAQTSASLDFKMISSNSKLIITKNPQKVQIFIKIIGWFSLSIIILSFLGFLFHKMLGLELLHSLQVITSFTQSTNSTQLRFQQFLIWILLLLIIYFQLTIHLILGLLKIISHLLKKINFLQKCLLQEFNCQQQQQYYLANFSKNEPKMNYQNKIEEKNLLYSSIRYVFLYRWEFCLFSSSQKQLTMIRHRIIYSQSSVSLQPQQQQAQQSSMKQKQYLDAKNCNGNSVSNQKKIGYQFILSFIQSFFLLLVSNMLQITFHLNNS